MPLDGTELSTPQASTELSTPQGTTKKSSGLLFRLPAGERRFDSNLLRNATTILPKAVVMQCKF